MVDFRSSSLCNDIYIVIVKTINSRLKQNFHFVISSVQSAFIPNRFITNNIIIGYKCLHKIRYSKEKKRDLEALKLDISKVYGKRVEFFEKYNGNVWILLKMGRLYNKIYYHSIFNVD